MPSHYNINLYAARWVNTLSTKLIKSTVVVGSMTFLSRLLGFVRDIVIARFFGAGAGTDAFFVAFKIPNFMRRLFAEGAFSQAFVPVLSEYKEKESQRTLRQLIAATSGTLAVILFVVTVLGVLGAPLLIYVFAPGFSQHGSQYDMAVDMLRITFPYLLFISLTAMAGGVLNTFGKFAVPAFTPIFLNLSFLAAVFWLSPLLDNPVYALAWGVLLAGIIQLTFQFIFLKRLDLLMWPRFNWADSGVQKIIKLMLPALFGVSVTQINLLLDTLLASFLVSGSVSWLYYSDRLVEFPLGVFGIALATVLLPNLSKSHAANKLEQFSNSLDSSLRWVLIIGVPAALGLCFLAEPMLATLFQYGEFSASDVKMASLSLMAYSVGLVGFILVKVLVPGFTARQQMKAPVRIGMIAVACNMLLSVSLVFVWQHAGLALATSIAAFVNAGLLLKGLLQDGIYTPRPGWLNLLFKVLIANVLAAVVYYFGHSMEVWLAWSAFERTMYLMLEISKVVIIYFAALYLLGVRATQLMPVKES